MVYRVYMVCTYIESRKDRNVYRQVAFSMYFSTGIPEVLCCPDFTEVSMELPSCCDASKACVGTCWRSCCASSRLGKQSKSEGWWADGDVDHKLWHVKFGKIWKIEEKPLLKWV